MVFLAKRKTPPLVESGVSRLLTATPQGVPEVQAVLEAPSEVQAVPEVQGVPSEVLPAGQEVQPAVPVRSLREPAGRTRPVPLSSHA